MRSPVNTIDPSDANARISIAMMCRTIMKPIGREMTTAYGV